MVKTNEEEIEEELEDEELDEELDLPEEHLHDIEEDLD